ncbi:sulfotransferase [soil metagenome]
MAVINNKLMPNFLIVGAAKCGTTSLYHYLLQHPDVYMSPIKEPNHFSTDILPEKFSPMYLQHEKEKRLNIREYVNGPMLASRKVWGAYVHDSEDYQKLFKFAAGKKAIGEISNSYLFSNVAADRIRKEFPDMKIVMILRQPAERAYSHYMANLRDGRTVLSFRDELEDDAAKSEKGWGISHVYYELGLYSKQVQRYLNNFPADQVNIFLFDDLKKDTAGVAKNLFNYLNIPDNINLNYTERRNEALMPKNKHLVRWLTKTGIKKRLLHIFPEKRQEAIKGLFFSKKAVPKLSMEDRKWLTEKYRTDILELEKIINRDLSAWLK